MHFLVAYDVADPKRLRRVARCLERRAVRVQKSVFLFAGTEADLMALLDEAAGYLKLTEDIVQAWKLRADQPPTGVHRGTPAHLMPAAAVFAGTSLVCIAPRASD